MVVVCERYEGRRKA